MTVALPVGTRILYHGTGGPSPNHKRIGKFGTIKAVRPNARPPRYTITWEDGYKDRDPTGSYSSLNFHQAGDNPEFEPDDWSN